MKLPRALAAICLLLMGSALSGQSPEPVATADLAVPAVATTVPVLQVSGVIGPATADYIARGLRKAAEHRAPLLILQIDTPGGLDSATRQIIKEILQSTVPVATWVAPGGARAASAGAYIMYASHIAAMAPGTNLGAATPVPMGGLPGSKPPPANDPPVPRDAADNASDSSAKERDESVLPGSDAMTRKIVNDSAAYLRSLAQMRGRNVDWADRAVREGVSLSADEAIAKGVIDLIAVDLATLLQAVHGRAVRMSDDSIRTIDTRAATATVVEPDWRTQVLAVITNPTMAYLLLLLGIYGIYFELTSPGFGFPGVAGTISLLVGMFALQMLPVSYAGVALIVLGFALLVAEAWMPSFGVLGVGGIIAFVIGSLLLIDTDVPGFGIPIGLIASVAILNALFVLIVFRMAMRARKRPVVTGSEELPGSLGEVLEVEGEKAWARIHGERWQVRSAARLQSGQCVRVLARQGLVLVVEPDTRAADRPRPTQQPIVTADP